MLEFLLSTRFQLVLLNDCIHLHMDIDNGFFIIIINFF